MASMFLPSSPGVQPEVGPNPYSALGPPNERYERCCPGVIPATLMKGKSAAPEACGRRL